MINEFNNDGTGWARFSDDMNMRYRLARSLRGRPLVVENYGRVLADRKVCFVMLNPSTASAFVDDPTIRRCIGFARSLGADVLEVVNLFALRSTNPGELYKLPAGQRGDDVTNNQEIMAACDGGRFVIAAWGKHGALDRRGDAVRGMLASVPTELCHLGTNKDGSPKHPLYLKGGTEPQEWIRG